MTGDETWVYGCYDVETKAQSFQWKRPEARRPKKARQVVRSNVKVLLTVFFNYREFLPTSRRVDKGYYPKVMRPLRVAIRRKCPDSWQNNSRLSR